MSNTEENIRYWVSLFPEYRDEKRISELLEKMLGKNIHQLAEEAVNLRKDTDSKEAEVRAIIEAPQNKKLADIREKLSKNVSMYGFYEPIINLCLNRYSDRLEEYDFPVDEVIKTVLTEISEISLKTLVLDVNDAREAGILSGENSEERYSYYENQLLGSREYMIKLYAKYSELVRLVIKVASDCCDYFLEILMNFEREKEEAAKLVTGGKNPQKITEIRVGQGDRHNGKSVAFVTFDDGSRVIYKPHSLVTEEGFGRLIEKMNRENDGTLLDMKATEVYSGKNHGWVKIIGNKEAENLEDVRNFYIRSGQILCLLYTLNTVDCHFENIISYGEYPVIIDCETLFHPYIVGRNSGIGIRCDSVYKEMSRIIDTSVLKVGLLPNFMIGGNDKNQIFDISGLGDCENMEFPFKQMKLIDAGKDTVRIGYDFFKASKSNNCPVCDGRRYTCYDFADELKKGFEAMYRFITARKDEYIRAVKEYFSKSEVRLLFRATHIYSRLLLTSYHPDFMQDRVSRRVLLSRIGINSSESYGSIIGLEAAAMERGNVPIFTCIADSRDIISEGVHALDDYLEKSPLGYVLEKVEKMDEKQLEKQLEFISMSFSMHGSNVEKDLTGIRFDKTGEKGDTYKGKWLDTAKEIGDYLITASSEFRKGGNTHRDWVSCTLKGNVESPAEIAPVGYDIYNGSSGIILFLMKLSEITGERKYYNAAIESLNSIYAFLEEVPESEICSVGLFNGISGYLYAMSGVETTDRTADWYKYSDKIFRLIDNSINKADSFDMIGGLAGCITALADVYENSSMDLSLKKRCQELSLKCVERITREAYATEIGGVSWKNTANDIHMTGFAHGNAGIIASLARAMRVFGEDKKAVEIIDKALQFERSLYNKNDGNWLINDKEQKYGNGWCHGVPGILLEKSELIAHNHCDREIIEEFETALDTTVENTFGIGPSLCHGDLGNIQIVHYAALVSENDELRTRCEKTFDSINEKVIIPRFRGKAFRGASAAGLMIGSAGYGYTILRMLYPEKVKMILGA